MKLIFGDEFIFYTSSMYEICLHCHWLGFSSFILNFGQCARWLIAIFVLNSSEVISFFGNVLVTHWVSIHLWKRSLRWKIVESWPRGHTSSEATTLFVEKFTYTVAKVAKVQLFWEGRKNISTFLTFLINVKILQLFIYLKLVSNKQTNHLYLLSNNQRF